MRIAFKYISLFSFALMVLTSLSAQDFKVKGRVLDSRDGSPVNGAYVSLEGSDEVLRTNEKGLFVFQGQNMRTSKLMIFADGLKTISREILIDRDLSLKFEMDSLTYLLETVEIREDAFEEFGIGRLKAVEGTAIYAGKKNEVILIDKMAANLATNNSRQVFAKISGLNIWESDGAGLQLGIGGRGLSPNRTSNFNVRQNGYDISADALGYPESYYTPPSEAVERIEVVRGAASLQYGTQFGGMLNFVMKKAPKEKAFQLVSRQTVGSFGLINLFNSIGGTVGKFSYYGFYQHKTGNGWRSNSEFTVHTAYANIGWQVSPKVKLGLEYTMLNSLAHQPGGLTDFQFEEDPRQSNRERNWFRVKWNVAALHADVRLTDHLKLNSRIFGLLASREALGVLGAINRTDPGGNRNLLVGKFRNFGNETRLIYKYDFRGNPSAFLVGARVYSGNTQSIQGDASDGKDADFQFLNPATPEHSSYLFPSFNFAAFAENVLNITPELSITPGIRFEHIRTGSEGYYFFRQLDYAGNVILEEKTPETRQRNRSLVLLGLGVSYKPWKNMEWYGNISQNYRAINFNDLRVVNPNFRIDPNIQDEKGFNSDLGFRGRVKNFLIFDISLFYLQYKDRIGVMLMTDPVLYNIYRYRTNLADSRSFGIESFGEFDIANCLSKGRSKVGLSVFLNAAYIRANYFNANVSAVEGNQVELVPAFTGKSGITLKYKGFTAAWQFAYTARHFSDATNAEKVASAVDGVIPAYQVMDLHLSYEYKFLKLETGINNLANQMYFTRRASGYPGPGIIPADGRSYFMTLQVRL